MNVNNININNSCLYKTDRTAAASNINIDTANLPFFYNFNSNKPSVVFENSKINDIQAIKKIYLKSKNNKA